MRTHSRRAVAVFLALATFAAGCRSSKEFANLGRAGTTYAAALDNLLVATINIEIDTTSERLLQDDALSNQTPELYKNLSVEDEKLLKTVVPLRRHVQLLSRYFGLMYELATSDAPDRAKQAIGSKGSGIIGALNTIGNQLRSSDFITGAAAEAAAPITRLVVSGMIRGALKDELDARKETIQKELLLQEELLKELSDRISHNLTITREVREDRLVIVPLTSPTPIARPDEWIANRRSVLTMKLTADQLTTASNNVKKLREAFEDLVSGKLTLDRVNSLLADFEALLSIAEKLNG